MRAALAPGKESWRDSGAAPPAGPILTGRGADWLGSPKALLIRSVIDCGCAGGCAMVTRPARAKGESEREVGRWAAGGGGGGSWEAKRAERSGAWFRQLSLGTLAHAASGSTVFGVKGGSQGPGAAPGSPEALLREAHPCLSRLSGWLLVLAAGSLRRPKGSAEVAFVQRRRPAGHRACDWTAAEDGGAP